MDWQYNSLIELSNDYEKGNNIKNNSLTLMICHIEWEELVKILTDNSMKIETRFYNNYATVFLDSPKVRCSYFNDNYKNIAGHIIRFIYNNQYSKIFKELIQFAMLKIQKEIIPLYEKLIEENTPLIKDIRVNVLKDYL